MKDIGTGERTGSIEVYTCAVVDSYANQHLSYAVVCELVDIMCAVPLGAVHDMLDEAFTEWGENELLGVLVMTLLTAWDADDANVVAVDWRRLLDRKLVGAVNISVEAVSITLH